MAKLFPKLNDASTFIALGVGTTLASDIDWEPIPDFRVEIQPEYQLELFMNETKWQARYYGPSKIRIRHPIFLPDRFRVALKPQGLGLSLVDMPPNQGAGSGIEGKAITKVKSEANDDLTSVKAFQLTRLGF